MKDNTINNNTESTVLTPNVGKLLRCKPVQYRTVAKVSTQGGKVSGKATRWEDYLKDDPGPEVVQGEGLVGLRHTQLPR